MAVWLGLTALPTKAILLPTRAYRGLAWRQAKSFEQKGKLETSGVESSGSVELPERIRGYDPNLLSERSSILTECMREAWWKGKLFG